MRSKNCMLLTLFSHSAQALEAFDTLTATVEEYHTTLRGGPPAAPSGEAAAGPSAGGPAGGLVLQPPPSAGNPFQVR